MNKYEMEQRNKARFRCANCSFIFDVGTSQEEIKEVRCPHCNSNACDRKETNEKSDRK